MECAGRCGSRIREPSGIGSGRLISVEKIRNTDACRSEIGATGVIIAGADGNVIVATGPAATAIPACSDSDTDNVYTVIITVTDNGALTDSQTIIITVVDVNEAPVITSNDSSDTASISLVENNTAAVTTTSLKIVFLLSADGIYL